MTVKASTLLEFLPPFNNKSVLIKKEQVTHDIVKEVGEAHKFFAHDYDYIYQFFDTGSIKQICKSLFDFCKENILYVVESEGKQTTKSPAAIITIGNGDCKHYAGFIAGVLSAIVRNTGRKIDWCYTFASYSYINRDVEHVFITVFDKGKEIWVDPVLCCFDSRSPSPIYIVDKKVNNNAMLNRVSGIGLAKQVETTSTAVDYNDNYLQVNAQTQTVDIPTDLNDIDTTLTDVMTDNIKQLLYYGIIDTNANIYPDVYVATLASLSPADADSLQKAYGEFYQALQTVGDIFGDIWNSVKQIGLAPARGAYLALVSLNVFGLASKMKGLITNPDGSSYQAGIDRLEETWHKKLMGDTNLLLRAINNGAPKKAIFGIGDTAPALNTTTPIKPVAPALALSAAAAAIPGVNAWVAVAIAVITAMAPIITNALKAKQAEGYAVDPSLLSTTYAQPSASVTLQKYLPYLIIAGAGIFIYLDSRKKRR